MSVCGGHAEPKKKAPHGSVWRPKNLTWGFNQWTRLINCQEKQGGISFKPRAMHKADDGPLKLRGLPSMSVTEQPASMAISAAAA